MINVKKTMDAIHRVFADTGRILDNWRLKYLGHEVICNAYGARSDWMWIHIHVYKYRCRKPCVSWHLAYNYVRKALDMSKSKFVNL